MGERARVLEEGLPGRQVAAHRLVAGVEQIEDGVGEEGQQDQSGQQGGEMLLAVAVVVLEMIALGFNLKPAVDRFAEAISP